MACTKSRRIFWIAVASFILAAVAGLSYYIWYATYYKHNIADHVHTIKFTRSEYKVKVIWRRKDQQCRAEIYLGRHWQHEIDLNKWFVSNERENGVWLESGYGPGMLISVHEDSPNFASISFCTSNGFGNCCTDFNLNHLQWDGESAQDQNEIDGNLSSDSTASTLTTEANGTYCRSVPSWLPKGEI